MRNSLSAALALTALAMLAACSSDDPNIAQPQVAQQVPIGFSNYVGRATRGSVNDISTIGSTGNKGFGVFAMYTNDNKQYVSGSSVTTEVGSFAPDFMANIQVKGSASTVDGNTWSYQPLRYWPGDAGQYISFLAYAPWADNTSLVASDGTASGDLTFIKHTVAATPADQIDILHNTANALNQYLYPKADGTGYETPANNGNFTSNGYKQKITLEHATARVAFAITSNILAYKDNFAGTEDESDARITINKVVLLGDNQTALATTASPVTVDGTSYTAPTGAFTKSAYLNLLPNATTDDEEEIDDAKTFFTAPMPQTRADETAPKLWVADNSSDNGKLSFTFANSDGDTVTYDGTYVSTATGNKWQPGSGTGNVIKGTKTTEGTTTTYGVNAIGNSPKDYLFIIPQQFGMGVGFSTYPGGSVEHGDNLTGEDQLYCYIDYTVKYNSITSGELKDGINYKAYGHIEQNFEAGKAYVIVINIGGQDLPTKPDDPTPTPPSDPTTFAPIIFNVESIADWGTETETELKL